MDNLIEMDKEQKAEFLQSLMLWDSQKLAIETNKKMQDFLKCGEGRIFAEAYLLGQILLLKNGQSSFFSDYRRFGNDFTKLLQISAPSMLQNYIFHGKVFSMTKPVYDLLQNTKNKLFLRKHPFRVFAVDQKIKTKFEGLNILFIIFFEVSNESDEPKGANYLMIGIDERDNADFWVTGDILTPLKDCTITSTFSKEETIELHKKTREIYANFLDYLHHPYSKQILFKAPDNTISRIKRGKFPRQDKIVIDIRHEFFDTRKTRDLQNNTPYTFKFWVRGHFKHFRNKERFKKIYSLPKEELEKRKLFYNGDFLSKWVLPYIKGIGELKEKIRRAV